jgi:hypothetical protein
MKESEEKQLKDLVLIDRKEYRVRVRKFLAKYGSKINEINRITKRYLHILCRIADLI